MQKEIKPILFGTVAWITLLSIITIIASITFIPAGSAQALDKVPAYTLREYHGKIGVFRHDQTVPEKIINTAVNALPEFDRQSLADGIEVYSQEELARLIEDFDG